MTAGTRSTCLSVQPVVTEFGRKTRIHQSSCNSDLTCLQGDCPSFLLVEPRDSKTNGLPALPVVLREPIPRLRGEDVLVRMPGIGGTGVVTVSAILQMAAHLDGLHTAGLEQVGLAQKGGPVISDVRIAKQPVRGALRASRNTVDVLLGFDVLAAADEAILATLRRGRTVAVLNTDLVPTAAMVTGQSVLVGAEDSVSRILAFTCTEGSWLLPAQTLAEALFGDHMPANMLLLGAAYQHGCLPVSAAAIEEAIALNGSAVSNTVAAFRWGRAAVLDPAAVCAATGTGEAPALTPEESHALRVKDLTHYQNADLSQRYADETAAFTANAITRVGADEGRRIGHAYAIGLHRLLAYKDEYEVARLHLDPTERARLAAEFGPNARLTVLLHPPALRSLGMTRKIRLRRSARPLFQVLYAARRLRGTRLDPFGYAHVRRVERALISDYRDGAQDALGHLRSDTVDAVIALLELPAAITGYEEIKLARVTEFRERMRAGLIELAG